MSIRHLADLQGVRASAGGLRIGAATLLADVVENPMVQERTPLLAMAAGKVGTPQIRNMGTIGGNLCQRPRCWYYRNKFPCYKHGGNTCFSAAGENDYHAILQGGPSYIVHPSDAGTRPRRAWRDGAHLDGSRDNGWSRWRNSSVTPRRMCAGKRVAAERAPDGHRRANAPGIEGDLHSKRWCVRSGTSPSVASPPWSPSRTVS